MIAFRLRNLRLSAASWLLRVCACALIVGAADGVAEERLPRVLILGDSVYQQPAGDAAKELKGRVEVVYVALQPGEVRNVQTVLKNFESLVGEGPWDLIHFNVGLGDLVHRAPGMKSFRVMPIEAGGVRAASPKVYEEKLRELVARLRATNAKLVWASTTPIRHSTSPMSSTGTG